MTIFGTKLITLMVVIAGLSAASAVFAQSAPSYYPPYQPTPPPYPPGIYCPLIYDPVCGIDGRTYSSACEATHQYRVGIAYHGACRAPVPQLPPCNVYNNYCSTYPPPIKSPTYYPPIQTPNCYQGYPCYYPTSTSFVYPTIASGYWLGLPAPTPAQYPIYPYTNVHYPYQNPPPSANTQSTGQQPALQTGY